jgi:hypothetical protein
MIEKYGNKSNLEKEYRISNGYSTKTNITTKRCGATPKRKSSIILSSTIS